jgi:hypothetical protein
MQRGILKKEDWEVLFGLTGLRNTEVAGFSETSVNWCWQPTVNMEEPVPSETSANSYDTTRRNVTSPPPPPETGNVLIGLDIRHV